MMAMKIALPIRMTRLAWRWRSWAFALMAGAQAASTAGAEAWSEPVVLYEGTVRASRPLPLADPWGGIHLFYLSNRADQTRLQMYTHLVDGRWSAPRRILSERDTMDANFAEVAHDEAGSLHLVWQGAPYQAIYHSRVHASEADRQDAWSPARKLVEEGGFASHVAAQGGRLHFVAAERSGAIVYRRSEDGGRHWSTARTVLDLSGSNDACNDPRLALEPGGRIHLTWSQFRLPSGWPATGGYYMQSSDGAATWSPPIAIATGDHRDLNVAVTSPDVVHVLWNGVDGSGARTYQWRLSRDGGRTWSEPASLSADVRGDSLGFPALAVDSSARLHVVTLAKGRNGKDANLYHSVWDEQGWSTATALPKRPAAEGVVRALNLAISAGNHLHVAYQDDRQRIWYTHRYLDAPAVAARQLPDRDESRPLSNEAQVVLVLVAVVGFVWWVSRGRAAARGAARRDVLRVIRSGTSASKPDAVT